MEINKDKVITQDEMNEPAPIDQVADRVDAEMKLIEGQAKEQVAHGLQDEKLEQEAQQLKQEGERRLKAVKEAEKEKGKP